MLKALVSAAVIVAGAVVLYAGTDALDVLRLAEAASSSPGHVTAAAQQPARTWRFGAGPQPGASAWGEAAMVGDTLQLTSLDDVPAVYIVPVEHSATFSLKTDVQFLHASGAGPSFVHLGTGRLPPDTLTGTGVSVDAGAGTGTGACVAYSLRHFIGPHKLGLATNCRRGLDAGAWYELALQTSPDGLAVSVDGERNTFRELGDLTRPGVVSAAVPLLAGLYQRVYVGVTNGVAQFRFLEVGPPTGGTATSVRTLALPPNAAIQPPAPIQASQVSRAGGAGETPAVDPNAWWVRVMRDALYAVILLVCLYMVRHYGFTLNRLFGRQRHPYLDVDSATWPSVTIMIPAHNEEAVMADILDALLDTDYPEERLRILAINDRSGDRTGEIIDEFASRYPGRVIPLHRRNGHGGKAAALDEAMGRVVDDVVLVFDADYYPGRGLIKQLVAPFFDPEVGTVMGRVVPYNVGRNLLTRTLDLERAGGYQVDQQARMNMRLVPQYGGTVGGVRRQALVSAGGWRTDSLAEDTDATLRLLLAGWKTVYQNRSECYEQVPETWSARIAQLMRWTRGHNQALARYVLHLVRNRRTTLREKIDGLMVLNIYLLSPILLIGWMLALALWYLGVFEPGLIAVLLVVSYSALGNFAIFAEIAAATYLDGSRGRIRLLPLMMGCFIVSLVTVTRASIAQLFARANGGGVEWAKTARKEQRAEWT
jgi:cellulose synthase/poly-beta-1,6-N-acetylglucosamine synthase-like glycosyltransferase